MDRRLKAIIHLSHRPLNMLIFKTDYKTAFWWAHIRGCDFMCLLSITFIKFVMKLKLLKF